MFCLFFFLGQAEHLFTPADYETALLFVLGQCAVDATTLDQIHTKLQAALEDRRLNLKMSRMTVIQGRPRLRDKVSSELKTDEKKTQVDTQLDTWDSYTGFCYKHQFPPTLSERVGDVERVIVDDAVAVEQTIVADARAVEATLAADALAVEKALVADAEAIEQVLAADAVALGKRAAAAVSLPSRAAVAVEQAAAEELREAAAFLEKVEREAVEGPLMRVGRAIGLVK